MKLRNTLRATLVFVCTVATVPYLLYVVTTYALPSEDLKPDSSWVETLGTVTKMGYGRSGVGWMDYTISGIPYRGRNSRNDGRVLGEKYVLVVNPTHPDQYKEKYWQPVFSHEEQTGFTTGTVTRRYRKYAFPDTNDPFATDYGVEFTYTVNATRYERSQDLPPQSPALADTLQAGDGFQVQYLLDDPQRAALYFETPAAVQTAGN